MRNHLVILALVVAIGLGVLEFGEQMAGILTSIKGPSSSDNSRQEASVSLSSIPQPRQVGNSSSKHSSALPGQTSLEVAENYVSQHRLEWQIQSHHQLRPVVFETPLGSRVKFNVFQDGIPILGIGIEIDVGRELSIRHVGNRYRPLKKLDLLEQEVMKPEEILGKSASRFRLQKQRTPPSTVLFAGNGADEPQLVYVMHLVDVAQGDRPAHIMFRASDGQILRKNFPRSEFGK